MYNMYKKLKALCDERGITGYRMCKDTGLHPSIMTDLKKGRKKTLSAKSMAKVAEYFGVSIEFLMADNELSEEEVNDFFESEVCVNIKKEESIGKGMLFSAVSDATEDELIQTANYLIFLKTKRKE